MPEAKFFGCWDLRRGSIVFSWLQMMLLVVAVILLSNTLEKVQTEQQEQIYSRLEIKLKIGLCVIQGVALIALTWGLAKRKYMFYQPWLFLSVIGLIFRIISLTYTFIYMLYNIIGVLLFFLVCCITALDFYIFYSVYTVYTKDKQEKPTSIRFDEEYARIPKMHKFIVKQ